MPVNPYDRGPDIEVPDHPTMRWEEELCGLIAEARPQGVLPDWFPDLSDKLMEFWAEAYNYGKATPEADGAFDNEPVTREDVHAAWDAAADLDNDGG